MLMTAHYRALALCKCTIASVTFHNVRFYSRKGRLTRRTFVVSPKNWLLREDRAMA
jgi:hypothetical protein